jgi:hypothetical protein
MFILLLNLFSRQTNWVSRLACRLNKSRSQLFGKKPGDKQATLELQDSLFETHKII